MKRALVAVGGVVLIVLALVAVSAQEPDPAAVGERVFREQGCYGCHMVGKFGTPIGPDLSRAGARHSEAELASWLRDPREQRPSAHMPKLELSEGEVRALAAFLGSRR
jgi:cytochrome c2